MSPQVFPEFDWSSVLDEILLAGIVVLGIVASVLFIATAIQRLVRRRATRAFAEAVSWGDLELAEVHVRQAIDPGSPRNRARRPGLRSWDELAVRDGSWLESSAELRTVDGLGPWCPTLTQDGQDDRQVMTIGRRRALQMTVLSRKWVGRGSVSMTAQVRSHVISGLVTVRPQPQSENREAVELWVHLEGPRGRQSRRAMRTIRRETRIALHRWATEHGPPPPQQRRSRRLRSRLAGGRAEDGPDLSGSVG